MPGKRWNDCGAVRKSLAKIAVDIFDPVCDYHKNAAQERHETEIPGFFPRA
jgi:hypothetical protein